MHTSPVMLAAAIRNAVPSRVQTPHAATKTWVHVWIWCCCFPFPPTPAQFNCTYFRMGWKDRQRQASSPSVLHQTGETPNKDTIHNSSSLNVSFLTDVQLNKLPKATWVVVVNSLCIAKSFHNWTVKTENDRSVNMWPACQQLHMAGERNSTLKSSPLTLSLAAAYITLHLAMGISVS